MRKVCLGYRLTRVGLLRLLLGALFCGALVLPDASPAHASTFRYNPILFVHGIEGSGAQFASQAMRFESNRYPATWIDEVDYNSTRAVGDESEVDQQIDDAIAALKASTGKSQVDVVAHSLGTSVMYRLHRRGQVGTRGGPAEAALRVRARANGPSDPPHLLRAVRAQ